MSQTNADRILATAFAMLAEGHGLGELGLARAKLIKRADVPSATFSGIFGPRARRNLWAEVTAHFDDDLRAEAEPNFEQYATALQFIGEAPNRGDLRRAMGAALLHDLKDYDTETMKPRAKARERLYYLMIALADLEPGPKTTRNVDYKKVLVAAIARTQKAYLTIYELCATATGREFLEDGGLERTQRSINAYLEGVAMQRRFDTAPGDDEVVDTVLRIFLATTRRTGDAGLDVDDELLPRAPT